MKKNDYSMEGIRKAIRELAESQKKTDDQQKKTDEQLKETAEEQKKTDKQIRNLGKKIGELTDGWGKFVEGLVAPSIPKLFKKNLDKFFDFFNEYVGMDLIGVVTGIRMEKGVEKYAQREGFFVLGPSGETMKILNSKGFRPKIWGKGGD